MTKDNKDKINFEKFIQGMVDVFYPPACPICKRPRPIVNGIRLNMCKPCRKKAPILVEPTCFKCGKKLDNTEDEYCKDCREYEHIYIRSFSAFEYTDSLRKSISEFKYKNKKEFGIVYAREMCNALEAQIKMINPDVLIAVPISKEKMKTRGYNQAQIIADEMGKILGIPVDTELVYRIKNTTPMKNLDKANRIENLKNAFQVTKNVVRYKKVMIVDDIYTTGATIDAIALELRKFGIECYGAFISIGKGF